MNNNLSFLEYIHKQLSSEAISMYYEANNISYEKCNLYNDYTKSLMILVFDTYMGDDVTNLEQKVKHFKWCYITNVNNFKKEKITIDNLELYEYFLHFLLEVFYNSNEKDSKNYIDNVLKMWDGVFNYTGSKTQANMDTLIEIYRIFEKSLKK